VKIVKIIKLRYTLQQIANVIMLHNYWRTENLKKIDSMMSTFSFISNLCSMC